MCLDKENYSYLSKYTLSGYEWRLLFPLLIDIVDIGYKENNYMHRQILGQKDKFL